MPSDPSSAPNSRPADPGSLHLAPAGPLVPGAPQLSRAGASLMREVDIVDESGARRSIQIPAERALTLYLDRQELVTLMTLGSMPELLVLGYLSNQRLIDRVDQVASITVDWEVEAAAVTLRPGGPDWRARTAHRVVTTGCGQGTVYGDLMAHLESLRLPDAASARVARSTLWQLLETMRSRDCVHRRAGSVHGCALFQGSRLLAFVEDVGRHNAVDTLAGWMALHGVDGRDKLLYTTGRLTSEMVAKAAQIGVPIVISRNGVTATGQAMAQGLGMALFGRAVHRRFLCYSGVERLDLDPQGDPARAGQPT